MENQSSRLRRFWLGALLSVEKGLMVLNVLLKLYFPWVTSLVYPFIMQHKPLQWGATPRQPTQWGATPHQPTQWGATPHQSQPSHGKHIANEYEVRDEATERSRLQGMLTYTSDVAYKTNYRPVFVPCTVTWPPKVAEASFLRRSIAERAVVSLSHFKAITKFIA